MPRRLKCSKSQIKLSDMKTNPLKSVLQLWQEIVFIVPLAILLVSMALNYSFVFRDAFSTICFCFFLFLFLCLLGQLFFKKKAIAIYLAFLLGICSIFFILLSLYALSTSPKIIISSGMLIFGIFLFIAAITMPINNRKIFE